MPERLTSRVRRTARREVVAKPRMEKGKDPRLAKILEEFPQVRQTFNLVPSMMVQVEEYARGEAKDPHGCPG